MPTNYSNSFDVEWHADGNKIIMNLLDYNENEVRTIELETEEIRTLIELLTETKRN